MDHDFSEITSIEELETTATEAQTAANTLAERARAGEVLTSAERTELAGHFDRRDAARARITEVQAEEAAAQAEQDELLNRLEVEEPAAPAAVEPTAPEAPAEEITAPEAVVPEVPAEEAPVAEAEPVTAEALAASIVTALQSIGVGSQEPVTAAGTPTPTRRPVPRPEVNTEGALAANGVQVAITASATLGEYAVGNPLELSSVAEMIGERGISYGKPNGTAKDQSPEARHARLLSAQRDPVAKFTITRDDAHTLTGDPEIDEARVAAALDPKKVVGFNGQTGLTAAGGWCAPSEILYGIPVVGESLDGIASFPEMNAARGGIKSTLGPDFSTLYAAIGFEQTEAQAMSGATKDCYEVDCPSFTETRMDVKGVCLSVPILTQAGYPEYVDRITSGALAVHAHKMNAYKLAAVASGSSAITALDLGSVAESTLHSLELRAEFTRQKFRMNFDEVLEVKLPHWVKAYMREDLSLRMGLDPRNPIMDTVLVAHFNARHLSVEFVYDWQTFTLDSSTVGPTTFQALIYPAATWLVLSKDVISLSTVYDAAGLSVNTYTGTFTEEGVGVRKMTNAPSEKVTIAICARGRVGAANITCS